MAIHPETSQENSTPATGEVNSEVKNARIAAKHAITEQATI